LFTDAGDEKIDSSRWHGDGSVPRSQLFDAATELSSDRKKLTGARHRL
jgi:hypothetical protein